MAPVSFSDWFFKWFTIGGFSRSPFQKIFKRIQFLRPEHTVLINPLGNFPKRFQVCFTISFSALLFNNNKPALFKYFYMFGNSGSANFKILSYRIQVQ